MSMKTSPPKSRPWRPFVPESGRSREGGTCNATPDQATCDPETPRPFRHAHRPNFKKSQQEMDPQHMPPPIQIPTQITITPSNAPPSEKNSLEQNSLARELGKTTMNRTPDDFVLVAVFVPGLVRTRYKNLQGLLRQSFQRLQELLRQSLQGNLVTNVEISTARKMSSTTWWIRSRRSFRRIEDALR